MRTLLPLALLLTFSSYGFGSDMPPKMSGVSESIQPYIDNAQISGAVLLVADREKVLHLDAFGKADLASGRPMSNDTLFWIASMTKPVTATALMMLQDERKLSIDDPISKYIPEFANVKQPNGQPAELTIKHIMTHTSGLAETDPAVAAKATTLAELLPPVIAKSTAFAPGSKWSYCQSGINTGGRIVEIVSGMSYVEFVQKRLLDPLEMKDTSFYPPSNQLPRLATTYKRDGDKLAAVPIGFLNGKSPSDTNRYPLANGGLFSTAQDYARFLQMVLNQGTAEGRKYVSPQAVTQMTTVQSGDVITGFTPGNGWGIGWCVVREPQGITAALAPGSHGHGGAYGTQGWIDPVRGLVYVLMIQRTNFANPGGSDGSPVRKAFQDAVAAALDRKQ